MKNFILVLSIMITLLAFGNTFADEGQYSKGVGGCTECQTASIGMQLAAEKYLKFAYENHCVSGARGLAINNAVNPSNPVYNKNVYRMTKCECESYFKERLFYLAKDDIPTVHWSEMLENANQAFSDGLKRYAGYYTRGDNDSCSMSKAGVSFEVVYSPSNYDPVSNGETIQFGTMNVDNSKEINFNIINSGNNVELQIYSVELSGSSRFRISRNPSSSVQAGCKPNYPRTYFKVHYESSTSGNHDATIEIKTNAGNYEIGVEAGSVKPAPVMPTAIWGIPSRGNGKFDGHISNTFTDKYYDKCRWFTGDFDGNGLEDVALIYTWAEYSLAVVKTFVSDGKGHFTLKHTQNLSDAKYWSGQEYMVADINGDDLDDIILVYGGSDGYATVWTLTSRGNGRFNEKVYSKLSAKFWDSQRWLSGDVNGDGLSDLVLVYQGGENKATVMTFTSTGGGRFEYTKFQRLAASFWDSQRWLIGDTDGDSFDDLILVYKSSESKAVVRTHFSDGSGGFSSYVSQRLFAGFWGSQQWLMNDTNGDSKADLVLIYNGLNDLATVWTHTSKGNGTYNSQSADRLSAQFWDSQWWLTGDFNGDGYDDIMLMYER
ncbi:MAG: hypothetical protein GY754_22515 [bacterium]|nr:hypothetical protein [bacterium]